MSVLSKNHTLVIAFIEHLKTDGIFMNNNNITNKEKELFKTFLIREKPYWSQKLDYIIRTLISYNNIYKCFQSEAFIKYYKNYTKNNYELDKIKSIFTNYDTINKQLQIKQQTFDEKINNLNNELIEERKNTSKYINQINQLHQQVNKYKNKYLTCLEEKNELLKENLNLRIKLEFKNQA